MTGERYEADDEPPADVMPFETWAAISARVSRLDPDARELALEELAVDADALSASEARWGEVLADEVERGEIVRAKHYGRLCAQELARRAADRDAHPEAPPATERLPKPAPRPPPAGPHEPVQNTMEAPGIIDLAPAVPFRTLPQLSLAEWVALEKELSSRPGLMVNTLKAYGLEDLGEFRVLQKEWRRRFEADPVLRERYRAVREGRRSV